MNETTTADYLQLPDFPLTYPAPVSFVLRKLEMVRSELVRMVNDRFALAGVVMSVNGKAPDESKNVSLAASDVPATEKVDGVDVQTTVQARLDDTASGVSSALSAAAANKDALAAKADLVGGVVPASQLPSFVDDVLEYASSASFPTTGEAGKIYVALDTNLTYRWGGSKYVEISKSLALGETAETAYAGDKGKAATDEIAAHVARTDNPHGVTAKQLSLAAVATSGKYGDLTDTPKIPTALTDLTNATNGGYITSNQAHFGEEISVTWHGETFLTQQISLPEEKGSPYPAGDEFLTKSVIDVIDASFAPIDEPVFTTWRDGSSVNAGLYALAPNEYNTAVGMAATVAEKDADGASVVAATALGANSYTATSGSLAVAQTPDAILLNSKAIDSGASAKTLQAYLDEKADATDLSTLSGTVSSTLSAKRSLADLAVYEEKDGKVEKTDDALVKKSEVTDEYSDLWVLETGEEVELYFTWVEDNEYFWLSNFEGWDGSKGSTPPSFPAYYTTVLDAKATSEVLLTCYKNGSEASIALKATRRVKKNALGLACIGDNVSEFANDAGYVTTDEVDAKIEIMQSNLSYVDTTLTSSISSINTEISNLAQASTVDTISQRVNALSAKVDEANTALEEVV